MIDSATGLGTGILFKVKISFINRHAKNIKWTNAGNKVEKLSQDRQNKLFKE